jgi:prepilin signal peptidase PulO-like enzyme (type II secretory pathway)
LAGCGPCEVSVMTGWYAERAPDRSAKAVIAVTLLALLLVAAVPVALLAAVIMMVLGHVVGGLALFGGSVLAAVVAVALAGMTGMQHLRKLLARASLHIVPPDRSQYTGDIVEPDASDYTDVVQLDRSEYTEVR